MTNEANTAAQASLDTENAVADASAGSGGPINAAAASDQPRQAVSESQDKSDQSGKSEPPVAMTIQDFAKKMKGIFVSANDLACKGPEVAEDFVSLIRAATKLKQKNALAIMLKKTVEKNHHETLAAFLDAGILIELRNWAVAGRQQLMHHDDSPRSLMVSICNSMSKLPVTEDHIRASGIGHALRDLNTPRDVAEAASATREQFKARLNVLSSATGGRVQLGTGAAAAAAAAAAATAPGGAAAGAAAGTAAEPPQPQSAAQAAPEGAAGAEGCSDDMTIAAPAGAHDAEGGGDSDGSHPDFDMPADANDSVPGSDVADASDSVLSEPGSEGALAKMQRWTAGALGGIKAPLRGSLARLGSIHMHKGRGATGAMWSSQSRHPPSPTAAAAAAQPQAAERAAAAAAEAEARFADLIETPANKRRRIEASGKSVKSVTFAPREALEQVCLFSDNRVLPGFLTKEEAEEERLAAEVKAGGAAAQTAESSRATRFAESARQEHISENLQNSRGTEGGSSGGMFLGAPGATRDPRAAEVGSGAPAQSAAPTSAGALDFAALKRLKPQADWKPPDKRGPVLDAATGDPLQIAYGDESLEASLQHQRCSQREEYRERDRVVRLHVPSEAASLHEREPYTGSPKEFPAETPSTKHTVNHMIWTYDEAARNGPLNSPPTVVYYRHMLEARGLDVPASSSVWLQVKQIQEQARMQAASTAVATPPPHMQQMHAGHTPMHTPHMSTPQHSPLNSMSPMHVPIGTPGHTPQHTPIAMPSPMHVPNASAEATPQHEPRAVSEPPMQLTKQMHAPQAQDGNGSLAMHAKVATGANGTNAAQPVPAAPVIPQNDSDSGAVRVPFGQGVQGVQGVNPGTIVLLQNGQKMLITPVEGQGGGVVNGAVGGAIGGVHVPNGAIDGGGVGKRGRGSGGAEGGPPDGGREGGGGRGWEGGGRKRMRDGGWGGDDREEGGWWERGRGGRGGRDGCRGGVRNRGNYGSDFGDDLGDLNEAARIERGTQDLLDGIEGDRGWDGKGDGGGRRGRGRGRGGWDRDRDRSQDWDDIAAGRGGRESWDRGGGGGGRRGGRGGRICKFWKSPEGCFKGDECEFIHEGEGRIARGRGIRGGGRRGRGRGRSGWDD